jgi:hypothetical protein
MKVISRVLIGSLAIVVALASYAAADGLPDILGIPLGMPAQEAYAKLQAALPKNKLLVGTTNFPTIEKPVIASFSSNPQEGIMMGDEGDSVKVYVTLPPNKQAVWNVERTRYFPDKGIAKATLLVSLREKYGKETVAWIVTGTPTTDDSKVTALVWLFDEQGRPGALPPSMRIDNCFGLGSPTLAVSSLPPHVVRTWCHTSFIALIAQFSTSTTPELYDRMYITILNVPFALRAGDATVKWKNDIAEGAHKREIEKGKQQDKPKL